MLTTRSPRAVLIVKLLLGAAFLNTVVPVLIAIPFVDHGLKELQAEQLAGGVTEDLEFVDSFSAKFPAYSSEQWIALKNSPRYRKGLFDAAKAVKSDVGAVWLGTKVSSYLANHPDDTDLQQAGLDALQRAEQWRQTTMAPRYAELNRAEAVARLSLPVRAFLAPEPFSKINQGWEQLLAKQRYAVQHPVEYAKAEHEKIERAKLAAQQASPVTK